MADIALTIASKVITATTLPSLWSKETFVSTGLDLTGLAISFKVSDGRYAAAGVGRLIATSVTCTIDGSGNATAADVDFGTTEAQAAFRKTEPAYIWVGFWDVTNEKYLASGKIRMAWAAKPDGATATAVGDTAATGDDIDAAVTAHNAADDAHTGVLEPALGNPTTTGDVLASTDAGVRSWVKLGDVTLARIAGSTYSTVQHAVNVLGSSGRISGGAVTDAGSETVNVAAGTGWIKATDSDVGELLFCDWAASAGIAIPTDTTRYIKVDYVGGVATVALAATEDWDIDTDFPLAKVVNEGGTLHILNNPWWTGDPIGNIIERLQSFGIIVRDDHVGGLILSVTGTRSIAVTAGTLWSRLTEFSIPAIDTNVSGTVETYYRSGASTWTDADVSQYPITQYNRLSDNSLQSIGNNQYANWWVYAEADDLEISLVYPQATYSSAAAAEAEAPPSSIPTHIAQNGILIGRIIIKEGTDAAVQVDSAFSTVFTASAASDHGNLSGLSDDDHPQYQKGTSGAALPTGGSIVTGQLFRLTGQDGTNPPGMYWHDGTLWHLASDYTNYVSAVAPAFDDDNTSGYFVGARWLDLTGGDEYVCLDATTGAAVWAQTTAVTTTLAIGAITGTDTRVPYFDGTDGATDAALTWNKTTSVLTAGKQLLVDTGQTFGTGTGIAFGDGDTAIYESSDDVLIFRVNGTSYFKVLNSTLTSSIAAGGAQLLFSAASATVPSHTYEADVDTGMGRAAADALSLIAGAVEGIRITEDATSGTVVSLTGGTPSGTTHLTSALVVNPASATANADLIWAGVADAAVFQVDEDGDTTAGGYIAITDSALEGTPVAGAFEYYGGKMYVTAVATQRPIDRTTNAVASTVTVTNTDVETTLMTVPMAANSLTAENVFKLHADGVVENAGPTAADQITLRVKVGGVAVATLTPGAGNIASGTHWHLDGNATQRTIGGSGSRAIHLDLSIGSADEALMAVATVDTTADMSVTVTAEWATADAGNIISIYQGWIEFKF